MSLSNKILETWSVFDTFVQLTEGRSVQDIPKQESAKKAVWHIEPGVHDVLTRKPRAGTE